MLLIQPVKNYIDMHLEYFSKSLASYLSKYDNFIILR